MVECAVMKGSISHSIKAFTGIANPSACVRNFFLNMLFRIAAIFHWSVNCMALLCCNNFHLCDKI